MIVVTVDPELARRRYGPIGEICAFAAQRALERGMGTLGNAPANQNKALGDVLLGGTILAAVAALVWWSKHQRRARR